MFQHLTNRPVLRAPFLVLLAVLLVGALSISALFSSLQVRRGSAQEAQTVTGSAGPLAPEAGPHTCTIANIAVLTDRIHVKCTTPAIVGSSSIYYFAAPGDSANFLTTNRFLTLMNTAYALGKPLYVYYLPEISSNPPGCNTSDCRRIDWIYIIP